MVRSSPSRTWRWWPGSWECTWLLWLLVSSSTEQSSCLASTLSSSGKTPSPSSWASSRPGSLLWGQLPGQHQNRWMNGWRFLNIHSNYTKTNLPPSAFPPVLVHCLSPSVVWRKTWALTKESLVLCSQLVPPSTWMELPCMRLLQPSSLLKWTASTLTRVRLSLSGQETLFVLRIN